MKQVIVIAVDTNFELSDMTFHEKLSLQNEVFTVLEHHLSALILNWRQ